MKLKFLKVTAACMLALAQAALFADQTTLAGASLISPLELRLGSARSVVFGPAYSALGQGSDAFYSNPAGLAELGQSELSVDRNSWVAGTLQESALWGLEAGSLGGFALSFNSIDYGSLESRDNQGTVTGSFDANELGLGLGWGRRWLDLFDLGLSVKGFRQSLQNTSYQAFNADVGLGWSPLPGFRLGLAYADLGLAVSGYAQASALRGGLSWTQAKPAFNQVSAALGAEMDPQGSSLAQLGAEDLLDSIVSLRAAYQVNFSSLQATHSSGLSAGLGIRYQNMALDYAYLPFGDLGQSQELSLSYAFAVHSPKAEPVEVPSIPPDAAPKPDLQLKFQLPEDPLAEAKMLRAQGKNDEALALYQRIIQNDAKNAAAWRAMAELYFNLHQKEFAIQSFEEVLRLQPDDQLKQWLDNYKK